MLETDGFETDRRHPAGVRGGDRGDGQGAKKILSERIWGRGQEISKKPDGATGIRGVCAAGLCAGCNTIAMGSRFFRTLAISHGPQEGIRQGFLDIGAGYLNAFRRDDEAAFENRIDFAASIEQQWGGCEKVCFLEPGVFAGLFPRQHGDNGRICCDDTDRLTFFLYSP